MGDPGCLEHALADAENYVSLEIGLSLTKSRLEVYDPDSWERFCMTSGFEKNAEGIYVPQAHRAYIRSDAVSLISNAFHELYGHGLFCEESKLGRIIAIPDQTSDSVTEYLSSQRDPEVQHLGFPGSNLWNYEGFAVWMECLLCKETGNSNSWERKRTILHPDYLAAGEYFFGAEQAMGRKDFLSQLGFPNRQKPIEIVESVKRVYGPEFQNVILMLLYGSRKPTSDIDLFIISDNPSRTYFNGWLDIYELNRNEFALLISRLDISVTDPLFTGERIYGSELGLEQIRQSCLNMRITPEAIRHNALRAEKENAIAQGSSHDRRLLTIAAKYGETYSRNAHYLASGLKPLTLRRILQLEGKR
ncbi:hypothetical protein JW826_05685 [Candidatus Woesearchaeota archaeon]|nr:hypothetical protein [Candidatus Woesearchaeota archaeon]